MNSDFTKRFYVSIDVPVVFYTKLFNIPEGIALHMIEAVEKPVVSGSKEGGFLDMGDCYSQEQSQEAVLKLSQETGYSFRLGTPFELLAYISQYDLNSEPAFASMVSKEDFFLYWIKGSFDWRKWTSTWAPIFKVFVVRDL